MFWDIGLYESVYSKIDAVTLRRPCLRLLPFLKDIELFPTQVAPSDSDDGRAIALLSLVSHGSIDPQKDLKLERYTKIADAVHHGSPS